MKTATKTKTDLGVTPAFSNAEHKGQTFLGVSNFGVGKLDIYVNQTTDTVYARFGNRDHDVYEMSLNGETSNPALLFALDVYMNWLINQ